VKKLMKPIEVVSWSDLTGKITPSRFRIELQDGSLMTVHVDKLLDRHEEKIAGMRTQHFRCRSTINDSIRQYVLAYELATCRWYLDKW
jgi:hypothetical protein